MFVVFLPHHPGDGWALLSWGPGCQWTVERRHAAPAVVGRLGLVPDTEFAFWASRRTDETGLPPLFFEQETTTNLGS